MAGLLMLLEDFNSISFSSGVINFFFRRTEARKVPSRNTGGDGALGPDLGPSEAFPERNR